MKLEKIQHMMNNAEFIRRLQAAGQQRRAAMLRTNYTIDANRLEGELARLGAIMTPAQRAQLGQRIAALHAKAASIDRGSDPGGTYVGPLFKRGELKRNAKKR
jgi:hypothetical protein